MSIQTASTIVLNGENEVLLHERRYFHIWALPGGGLEPCESFVEAAERETLEETGYEVTVTA